MAASNAEALRVLAAAPEHAPGVANVAARSLPDPWPAAVFRRELERPMSRGRVALRGASCVAYVLGWRVLDEVEVLSLAVDPPWRRRGVGRRLLDSYLSELRGEGVRRVTLEVRASNGPAQELYRALGMSWEGERRRYYGDGEDALLYGARLR